MRDQTPFPRTARHLHVSFGEEEAGRGSLLPCPQGESPSKSIRSFAQTAWGVVSLRLSSQVPMRSSNPIKRATVHSDTAGTKVEAGSVFSTSTNIPGTPWTETYL